MKTVRLIASVAIVLTVAGAAVVAGAQSWKAGDKAPAFSAKGSDGKTHTLASLTKSRPLVLYFIGHTCPVNAQAVRFYNQIEAAYRGKVEFVGVINTDAVGYKEWQGRFKAPYTVLFDPDLKIIKAMKATHSPWTILIDKNGRIQKVWDGYSVAELNELGAAMAKAAKVKVAKLETSGAPTSPRAG